MIYINQYSPSFRGRRGLFLSFEGRRLVGVNLILSYRTFRKQLHWFDYRGFQALAPTEYWCRFNWTRGRGVVLYRGTDPYEKR